MRAVAALLAGCLVAAAAVPVPVPVVAPVTAPAPTAPPRFAALADPVAAWLPASLFTPADRAAAAAAPALRVAVPRGGVAAHLEVSAGGEVQGPQVQWLLSVARVLGLGVTPVVVADDAAARQAVVDGTADLVLAALPHLPLARGAPHNEPHNAAQTSAHTAAQSATQAPVLAGPSPAVAAATLHHSLGTGAQPLAWMVLREQRPLPLDRARIAHLAGADPVAADRLRRHYPAATLLPQPDAAQALQAVVDRRADAYVGSLLPALAALQHNTLQGLELRQVWPGAAGHRHLVLRSEQAALLPAFNKAIAAWRATGEPHRSVLSTAHRAATQLQAPLALPADLAGADTAVMDRLLKAPFPSTASAAQLLPLADRSTWRVGVLRADSQPAGSTAAALSGLDGAGQHTGVAADLVQELAQRLGLVVQLQPFDTEAAMLEALRAGHIDVLPLLEHTPQRTQGLQYTLPWLDLPQVLVGAERGPMYWGLESLRGLRLGMANGHPLRTELQRLHPGIQLVSAADGAAALALVQQGRADAALDIKPVVQQQLGSAAGHGLRVLGDVAEFNARYRVALPQAQKHLLPVLDAALTDIDAQERQRSLRRWVVAEPVAARPWWHSPWWPGSLAALVLVFAGLAVWGWRRGGRAPLVDGWGGAGRAGGAAGAGEVDEVEEVVEAGGADKTRGLAPAQAAAAAATDLHLENLLRSVVAPLRHQADAAGLRLVWALDEVLPARIHADATRLAELVGLLLQRAVTLAAPQGAQGRVAFKARHAKLENGHPALQLVVNASVSVDAKDAAADPQVLRAQHLAVALGGDLLLRSGAGVGHAVAVRLPLRGASRSAR